MRHRGFTVLEMLVATTLVVIVLLIVLAIALAAVQTDRWTRAAVATGLDVYYRRLLADVFSCMRPSEVIIHRSDGVWWTRMPACTALSVVSIWALGGNHYRLGLTAPSVRSAVGAMMAVAWAAGAEAARIVTEGMCTCEVVWDGWWRSVGTATVEVRCSDCTPHVGRAEVRPGLGQRDQIFVEIIAGRPKAPPPTWQRELAPEGLSVVWGQCVGNTSTCETVSDVFPPAIRPLPLSVHAETPFISWTLVAGSLRYMNASGVGDWEGVVIENLDGDGDGVLEVEDQTVRLPIPASAIDRFVLFYPVPRRLRGLRAVRCGTEVIPIGERMRCGEDSFQGY